MIERHRRLDRQVEHRGYRPRLRPVLARLRPGQRMEPLESAELPEPQAAERCGRVVILLPARRFQIRTGDCNSTKAVILKGKASGAQQSHSHPEARGVRRWHLAEFP